MSMQRNPLKGYGSTQAERVDSPSRNDSVFSFYFLWHSNWVLRFQRPSDCRCSCSTCGNATVIIISNTNLILFHRKNSYVFEKTERAEAVCKKVNMCQEYINCLTSVDNFFSPKGIIWATLVVERWKEWKEPRYRTEQNRTDRSFSLPSFRAKIKIYLPLRRHTFWNWYITML